MGPTLLCELGLFLLCTLLCTGHAQDAVLTIEPNWSSFLIGEFVTFMCDMNEGADTDWEYKLNKDGREIVPYNTHKYYILEITSASYSGEYQCSGHWKSSFYTKSSNTVSVTVSGKPRATLTAGTTIIPVGGSVTLTCSVGRSAEWKYEWFRRTHFTSQVQIRRDDQPNRVIRVSQGGIYRCRGRRGNPVFYTDISDEVSIEITFSNKVAVKQQQHNWPQIFSGETITLTCEVQEGGEPTEWEYEWRGPRQTTQWTHNYLTFRVSESSSGDYMCKSRRRDDSYSSTEWSEAFTLSVTTAPGAESSSFLAPLIVGLVCGVLLIFLLLLLRHFKKSKDSHLIRTRSTNQSSATNHMINQGEAKHSRHTSPLQDDSVLYAQVSYNKAKAKRSKGRSAPAAADETVYAEVKPQTAVGDCTEIIL